MSVVLEQVLEEVRQLVARLEKRLQPAPTAVRFEEAARLLSVSPKHVGRMVKSGVLRVALVGGARRITMAEIHRVLELPEASSVERHSPSTGSRTAKAEAAAMRAALKRR